MTKLTLLSRGLQWFAKWFAEPEASLDEVDEESTIGDYIEIIERGSRLPDNWRVEPDIVQFSGETLAEVVRLTCGEDGFRITLKPVDMLAPTETVKLYTRLSPSTGRTRRATVDSLSAAVAVADRIATSHRKTSRPAKLRSSSHRQQRAEQLPAEF